MKRCQHCGYPIDGEARTVIPDSGSGARPTLYWHESRQDCRTARDERLLSPLQRHLRRT